jgi:hypothetical protein
MFASDRAENNGALDEQAAFRAAFVPGISFMTLRQVKRHGR